MKPTPKGWPRISSAVYYNDPRAAIDWLCRVFGFEVRLKVEGEDGSIAHCELAFGEDGLIMPGGTNNPARREIPVPARSPRSVGGANTQCLAVFVDDVDAHCARSREMGARILDEPTTTDYGEGYWADRTYRAEDLEGHHWWFMQRVR